VKHCSSIILCIILLAPLPTHLLAQSNFVFGPSIRVNDDPAGIHFHTTTQRSIACRGDTIFLVWRDDRFGNSIWYNSRVFFSKSTDAGNTWAPNFMISQDSDTLWGYMPHLTLDFYGNLFCAYTVVNDNSANRDIYFTKSTDGGISFTQPVIVNDSTGVHHQRNCAIAVDSSGQYIFVAWQDWRNVQYEPDIYFSRSTDGGATFLPSVRVNDDLDTANQWFPVVACDNSGQNVYVAWEDQRDTLHDWDVYFSRSTNYGQTFEANYPVNDTNISGYSLQGRPSIYYKNGIICIGFDDWRTGAVGTYFDKSTDNGANFGVDICMVDTYGVSAYPSIAVDGSNRLFSVWEDGREYSTYGSDVYFSFSADTGQTFKENVLVNDHQGIMDAWDWDPSICVNDSGKVFVAWDADRNDPSHTNSDIYFAAGIYVGIEEYRTSQVVRGLQCYPNPFRQVVTISLQSSITKNPIDLRIYDITGQLITSYSLPSGQFSVSWDGRDKKGRPMPTGVYFVQSVDGSSRATKKVVKIE
jgi:hypothetical protein